MDEYIDVKIDVFEHTAQRARLRKTLTVSALIDEIFKEFDDIAADAPGKYALYLKGSERPLPNAATLTQLDIQPQDELIFNYTRQANRQMLDPRHYASLKDDSSGRVYQLQWQPALIGRPTNDAEHNIMLAVNLQAHPQGQTVSHTHARITFTQGSYFIESLAANNPLAVNGKALPVNTRRELKPGDHLLLGRNNLAMTFGTQPPSGIPAAAQPPAVQAAPVIPVVKPAKAEVEEVTYTPSTPIAHPAPAQPQAVQPAAAVQVPRLLIERAQAPNKVGQRLDLTSTPVLLGRDLPFLAGEGEISRRHAEINFDARVKQYTLTDLQSTNGVTLNGVRIEPNRPFILVNGTKIGLGGSFVMRFEV